VSELSPAPELEAPALELDAPALGAPALSTGVVGLELLLQACSPKSPTAPIAIVIVLLPMIHFVSMFMMNSHLGSEKKCNFAVAQTD
jgi:hypothetical protein